jgi:hypothetical protein
MKGDIIHGLTVCVIQSTRLDVKSLDTLGRLDGSPPHDYGMGPLDPPGMSGASPDREWLSTGSDYRLLSLALWDSRGLLRVVFREVFHQLGCFAGVAPAKLGHFLAHAVLDETRVPARGAA